MRTLRDINEHILDMRKSTWVDESGADKTFDAKTWNKDIVGLSNGASTLKTKTYIKMDAGPDYYIWWCKYTAPGYREYQTARVTLPATAVSIDTDPYWPEGFEPDVKGNFVFGDLILMKRKYVDHLKDEIAKVKRSQGSAGALMKEYEELAKREGMSLDEKTKGDLGSTL